MLAKRALGGLAHSVVNTADLTCSYLEFVFLSNQLQLICSCIELGIMVISVCKSSLEIILFPKYLFSRLS